ncbi:MAG TPA: DUF4240 domain-containing protein [Gaiellaceae bacterium]|nr:DUF4240 domain-containing protein [Gaiellaceae bacterium]
MSDRALVRASLVVSAAALGIAVLVVVVGGRGGGSSTTSVPRTSVTQAAVDAPAQPPQVPQTGTTTPTDQAGDSAFWQLVEASRRAAGNDTARQSELLKNRLAQLSPQAIIDFERTRHHLDHQAYTWSMWGAATVIEDGCSDDCFRDFRAYVISLGRDPYERALQNPDSLASVAQDAESGNWEDADDVAPDAYSSVTGNDYPVDDSDLSGPPAGTPLDLDGAELTPRYPQLAARFRGA